jgi:hypothetical protein
MFHYIKKENRDRELKEEEKNWGKSWKPLNEYIFFWRAIHVVEKKSVYVFFLTLIFFIGSRDVNCQRNWGENNDSFAFVLT